MDADMMTRSPEADQMDMMMMTMLHMDQANSDKFPHEQYFTPYPCNPSHDMSSGVADTLTPTTFHSLPTPPAMSFNRHPPPMPDEDHTLSSSPQTPAPSTVAAMREMIFRMAAMQPVHVDAEAVKAPCRRKNVRISKDPQSVAARHRRERISERIRILQRMVPGGTKMDTASMLDEAIHYVKFLKRQVRSLEEQEVAPQLPQPDQQQLSMFPAGFVEAEGSPTTRGDWHSGAPRWRVA